MQKQEALDTLREAMPQDSTVFVIQRHVTSSGLMRALDLLTIEPGSSAHPQPIVRYWSRAVDALGVFAMWERYDGLKVSGAGMDMHFHVVYTLATVLHGNGYALKHRTL